tara:strand:- start:341 stop:559 length:219 start_codon:yes stop_codon:yes gene_type:complete
MGDGLMKLKEGLELIIPFTPEQHFKGTGRRCKVVEIHDVRVYVHRYNEKKKQFNPSKHPVDKSFLEKLIEKS